MFGLNLTLRPGERLFLGGNVVIEFSYSSANRIDVTVAAPREVPILRGRVIVRESIDVKTLPMLGVVKPAIAEPDVAEPEISQEKHDAA